MRRCRANPTDRRPSLGDLYWTPPPTGRYPDAVGSAPARLWIALTTVPPTGLPADRDSVAAALCAAPGHTVEQADPPLDDAVLLRRFGEIWTGFLGWALADRQRRIGRAPVEADFEPAIWRLY